MRSDCKEEDLRGLTLCYYIAADATHNHFTRAVAPLRGVMIASPHSWIHSCFHTELNGLEIHA